MLLLSLLATALSAPTAFVGATVHPASGPAIEDGVVVVDEGRIVAVGARDSVAIPEAALRKDLEGKHLIPGLVDTHSHIGGGRLHEALKALQPGISAVDAIDPSHPSVARARAGGLTTVNVMPGSGKLMGGQTAYLKLRRAATVDALLLCRDRTVVPPMPEGTPERRARVCGGVKMANGTNPQGGGGDPKSRMGAAFLQRETLRKGQDRLKALAPLLPGAERPRGKKKPKPYVPQLGADALAEIVGGDRTVHFHTHRVDDIVTILRLQEEFGFDLVLHHVSEAWKVTELLGERQVNASLILLDSPGGKEEALEIKLENPALLEDAGAVVALHTDDPITDSRLFLRMGAQAVRGGLSEAAALRALTLNGARMLRVDDRTGSLEAGKDADFVVLSGEPFSTWTQVEQTWVEGELVFDRSRPEDRRSAVGGDLPGGAVLFDAVGGTP